MCEAFLKDVSRATGTSTCRVWVVANDNRVAASGSGVELFSTFSEAAAGPTDPVETDSATVAFGLLLGDLGGERR
jgi:hypothetical protein